jgi:hypothetical protein
MDLNNKSRFFLLELQNSQDFQTDDYRELVKQLISQDFYGLSSNEKKVKIKQMAQINALFQNKRNEEHGFSQRIEVRDTYKKGDDVSNGIYTCDEKAYILSLASTNIVMIFERADSHVLNKGVMPKGYEKEYCVINTHAKELLKNHLNRQIDDPER